MAFNMKGSPAKMGTIQGTAGHSSALKMKMESAAKMKAAMKMKEEAAMKMKMESAAKMKSPAKQAKPDFPDIDGDGNTTESMKQAAADKSGAKMKSPAKQPLSPDYLEKNPDTKSKYRGSSTKKANDPYAKALKKDPKLASYIKERKKHKPGSDAYEAQQAKINAAYGKKRSSKLKSAQIKNQAKKDAATTKPDVKAIAKGQKITGRADVKKAELTENVTRKLAKNEMKSAKRMKGKGSKEFLQAKKDFLQAKEDDRQGKEGGRRQGLFRKLSSRINKRRQAKLDKKLADKK
jgi:hypothetical protein